MISDIFGEKSFSNVNNMLSSGKIPHSFLIEGATFENRKEAGIYIAKGIVCEGSLKPCLKCRQCKITDDFSNPDIIFISPEENKKFISVAQIRKLRADAYVLPHSAQRKVFIIENAELMNEQAQNALLKVLEEPPQSTVFILLTPSRSLQLATVISRCSILKLAGKECIDESGAAKEFLSLLFDGKYYEMLLSLKPFEKDRKGAEEFFANLKSECVNEIKENNISNYRMRVLSRIFEQSGEYIDLINTNVNMPLLVSAAVCKFKDLRNEQF